MLIKTLKDFVLAVDKFEDIGKAYELFEYYTDDVVRALIYDLAATDSQEPFRDAMHTIGFVTY